MKGPERSRLGRRNGVEAGRSAGPGLSGSPRPAVGRAGAGGAAAAAHTDLHFLRRPPSAGFELSISLPTQQFRGAFPGLAGAAGVGTGPGRAGRSGSAAPALERAAGAGRGRRTPSRRYGLAAAAWSAPPRRPRRRPLAHGRPGPRPVPAWSPAAARAAGLGGAVPGMRRRRRAETMLRS